MMKQIRRFEGAGFQPAQILLLLVVLLLPLAALDADTHIAANCSQTAVQAAIDAASDGDLVTIPPGNCVWTGAVGWNNKNINIIGAGIGQTVITGNGARFYIHCETKATFRISGITFSGSDQTGVPIQIKNNLNTPTSGFRIDHVRFHYTADVAATVILVTGLTYGVIDNCVFDLMGGVILQHYAYTENEGAYQGTTSWSLPLDLGGSTAIYFEDNDVNFGSGGLTYMNDSWAGGRLVFRYNNLTPAMFQTHGARGNIRGGLKLEIYNNKMSDTDGNAHWDRLAQIRSGTGVFFNNSISGYDYPWLTLDCPRVCDTNVGVFGRCDGSSAWDGNTAGEAGWPCLDQPGRGPGSIGTQTSVPYYAWNNGLESGCHTGGACTNQDVLIASWGYELCDPGPPFTASYIKTTGDTPPHAGGVLDFVNNGKTPMPGYSPYTYPHPLRGENIKQDISLSPGWNWISFNVLPADISLSSVFSSILIQVEQVKTQTQSAICTSGTWKGDLADMNGIGQYKMYKVKVSQICTLTVTGSAITPTTPIALTAGWNWVAYLPTTTMPIATALASINGQVQEVKSLTQAAVYSGGAWTGTLTQLQPGQGYAIKMSGPGTLTYPAGK